MGKIIIVVRIGDGTYESPGLQHVVGISDKKWNTAGTPGMTAIAMPLVWHFVCGMVCAAGGSASPI